jgi:Transglycosylase SLT domain
MATQRSAAWRLGGPRVPLSLAALLAAGLAFAFVFNWSYQVVRKPAELVGLLSLATLKTEGSTWQSYEALFRAHATDIVSPALLAALAQAESHGNPHARTYWRWRWSWNLLEVYAPASSAVGLFQMTDGAFEEARRLCIHDHAVARAGAWYDVHACWFNRLYSRLVPSHAVELTAAHLHQLVVDVLATSRLSRATLEQRQDLAVVIHLCGPRRGSAFARRGFRVEPGETCGAHNLGAYLARIKRLKRQFARLERFT